MTWYYAAGGQQLGPVDEAALDDLVRRGVVRDDTLVWKAGMSGWQPLTTARPRTAAPVLAPMVPAPMVPSESQGAGPGGGGGSMGASAAAAPMAAAAASSQPVQPAQPAEPSPVETRYCSECGRPYPINQLYSLGTATVCTACYPAYMQRTSMGAGAAPMQQGGAPMQQMGVPMQMAPQAVGPYGWHYGGFWIRFVAIIIDSILVGIVSMIIRIPLMLLMGGGALFSLGRADQDPAAALAAIPMIFGAIGLSFLIQIAISVGYEVYFLSTRGATIGKMALGLKVVRADGGPISVGLAAGRFFARILSSCTAMIGFIIAGFDLEKRSLHDRICNTRVIYTR